MKREEKLFEEWFQNYRRVTLERIKDYGTIEDHPHWAMGTRMWLLEGWMARAALSRREGGG